MWITAILLLSILIGWFPVMYRRFAHDGKGRVLFRAAIWSMVLLIPAFLIAELTYRLPFPILYPALFLFAPLPWNVSAVWKLRRTVHPSRIDEQSHRSERGRAMSRESRRRRREARQSASRRSFGSRGAVRLFVGIVGLCILGLFAALVLNPGRSPTPNSAASASEPGPPSSYASLCALGTNELAKCDIALMNLLCAEELKGAENLDVKECLKLLDGIAQGVKAETDRHLYKFHANPAEFNHSEGYYRMMMMASVLQQDLGVHYSPERLRMPWEPLEESHRLFENAADVFIHGLARKGGTGTCSSMPVFYVAVGRRLGYPLSLVKSKGHLFARWDEGDKSFNIEGTSVGFVSHPDNYYRTFPVSFTADEAEAEGYLKSLTPSQEFAVFLSIRGHCLRAAGDFKRALGAFAQAFYQAPGSRGCQLLFARAEREAAAAGVLPKMNALALEIRDMALPPGPMQPFLAERKARLTAKIEAGAAADEIEPELTALKAELAQSGIPASPP
jgi:hypothetical protein